MIAKECKTCHQQKPLAEFHNRVCARDGKQVVCKKCACAATRAWNTANKEYVKRQNRVWYLKNRDSVRARSARWYEANTLKARENRKKYHAEHRDKVLLAHRNYAQKYKNRFVATSAVYMAIKTGKLVRGPCEACGATESVHGHHDDYSKPLDVNWLCEECHPSLHKWLRRFAKCMVATGLPCVYN